MMSLRRQHRWFGMGFLLAWALSHCAYASAQNDAPKPGPADKIRKTLDQVIALEYQGNSFNEAIAHFKERTQLPVFVDQFAVQQMGLVDGVPINIELRNVRGKVRQALQHLLSSHNLTYVILEDSLLITTEESALNRQMRQRVPIDLNEVPAAKALKDLSRKAGINLVVDPRVAKGAANPVSLQLDDATIETGLRVIAELADLKAVRMGNVIFVTDAVRAERIRREEMAGDDRGGGGPAIDMPARMIAPGGRVQILPAAPGIAIPGNAVPMIDVVPALPAVPPQAPPPPPEPNR